MASQTEWANRALDKLGASPLINITDNNVNGRLLNRMFGIVLDAELRARKWSFSIKRANLAADVAVPLYQYGSQYTLPTDCLRVLSLFGYDIGPNQSDYISSGSQEYVIEGRKILYGRANPGSPPASIALPLRYVARIEDTTLWDATFGEAFACRLAAECAESITQSTDKRRMAWQEYNMAIASAKRANAIELPSDSISDDTWIQARLR